MMAAFSIVDITWQNHWQNADNAQAIIQYILSALIILTVPDICIFKKSDTDIMITSVTLEIDLKNIRLSQCMIIDIVLYSKYDIYRLYIFLNINAQVSFLSQKIIIKEDF